MPRDMTEGERRACLDREIWLELREKKRVYDLLKKGQATPEDHKDGVRLCREKISNLGQSPART